MQQFAAMFLVPQWLLGLGGILLALLFLLRSQHFADGVKISQAFAWLIFGAAYLWLQISNASLTDPMRPFIVRNAIAFTVLIEMVNQAIMLRYGRRR